MRRRDFLTGATALAAYGQLEKAEALTAAQKLTLLGGARPGWVQPGAIIDEIFTTGQYWPRPIATELVDTRASSKYVTNASGVLIPVGPNILPISNAGQLVESGTTNLALQSSSQTTTPWGTLGGTMHQTTTAPDGVSLAWSSVFISESGWYQAIGLGSSAAYAYSVYVKKVAGTNTQVTFGSDTAAGWSGSTAAELSFNLDTLAFTGISSSITSYGYLPPSNGWYRVWLVATTSAGAGNRSLVNYASGGTGSAEPAFWGNQVEALSSATSYTPTTTASSARAADAITIQRTGIGRVVFTFDDNSQQTVSGINTAAQYTIPTNLNRPLIKRMTGYAS